MKRAISFKIVMVALLFFANAAGPIFGDHFTDLFGVNDPSIPGDTQDGKNLTRDTESGLDWLDVTFSLNRSYNDVAGELGAGGDYEGFNIATGPEVETLFDHAHLVLEDQGPLSQPMLDFFDLFGSAPVGGDIGSGGRYDDSFDGVDADFVGFARVIDVLSNGAFVRIVPDLDSGPGVVLGSPTETIPFVGTWLHRPVPEPSSLIMCCIGGGLVFSHIRRRCKASYSAG